MYLEFFKLWDEPFGVTPDPAYLYPSQTHLQALNSLREGIQGGRGFMTLIAEPGMGKTTLLYQLIEQLPQTARSAYLFQTQCNSLEFMQYLLNEIGVDHTGMGLVAMHRRLNEMLFNEMVQGKQFVLIVDESQNLSNAVLETIRLLSNFETAHSKLMQIVLAGQSDLANKLKQPDLSQLLQRITVMASLEAFSFEETAAYIRHRLKLAGHTGADLFDPAALAAVYRRSKGVPRNINRVCHAALSEAATEQVRLVTAAIVEKSNRGLGTAVEEPQRTRISNPPRPPATPAPTTRGHVAPSQATRDRVAPSDARAQVESRQQTSQSPSWHFSPTPPAPSENSAPTPPPPSARSSSFADASQPQSQIPPQPPPQSTLQQQFPPLPDFVPPEPRRRSYAWLAWAAVIVTIPILAALAAPANVRKALLQKIQASADSVASRNDPRPSSSPQKNAMPTTDPQPMRPTSDARNGTAKSDTARQNFKIVIDPGHGGADSGARGPNGLLEKSVCLEVALRLGQLIDDGLTGSEVIYTRSDDQNISPSRRDAVAGESSADLFISIHADALGDGQGPQAYYFGGSARKKNSVASGRDESAEQVSQQLASDIQSALAHQFKSEAMPMPAPKQPAFAMLNGIRTPAVVVEIPFSGDTSPLRDPEQRQQIAEALYSGIAAFLKSPDRSAR